MEKSRLSITSELLTRGQSLIDHFSALAKDIQGRIANPMLAGELPDRDVTRDILDACDSAQALLTEAREVGIFDRENLNLRDLVEELNRIIDADTWAGIQDEYHIDAERVLRISHTGGQIPAFLQEIHARANQCLEELSVQSGPAGITQEEWAERMQPFRSLWILVNEPDSLSEERAEELLKILEKEFGLSIIWAITQKRLAVQMDKPSPGADGPVNQSTSIVEATVSEIQLVGAETVITPDSAQNPIETGIQDSEIGTPLVSTGYDSEIRDEHQRIYPSEEFEDVLSRDLDSQSCSGICEMVWGLVAAKRTVLAYQLALCAEALKPVSDIQPSSVILRAAVLGPEVRSSSGEMVEQYRKCVEEITAFMPRWQESIPQTLPARLLILGSALRPALLAPGSGAFSILENLKTIDSLSDALGEIRRSITEFGSYNLELSAGVLKGVRDHAVWLERTMALAEEARCWLDQNRQARIIYAPTTDVWHRWLAHDGDIGRVLEIVINRNTGREQTDFVREAIKEWTDQSDVVRQLIRTDEAIRGSVARRIPIQARARTVICSRAQEFVEIAQRWIDTLNDEPRPLDDFRQQRADKCREIVQRHLPAALMDVASLATASGDSLALVSAVRYLHLTLEELGDLFDASRQENTRAVPVRVLLGEELLAVPGLELSEDWDPMDVDSAWLLPRLKGAAGEVYDPEKAFARQSQIGNHLATERIIEALEARSGKRKLIERLTGERDAAVLHCRHALIRKLEETRQAIEQAVCYDLITDEERARFLGYVEDCRLLIDDVRDFAFEHRRLEEIDNAMMEKRRQRINEVQRKLDDTVVPVDRESDMDLIRQALDRGDFLSANEYIELVRKGQPLSHVSEPARTVFEEFFPAFVQEFTSYIEGEGRSRPQVRDIIDGIRDRRSMGPVDMRGLPAPQAVEAAGMLEAWTRLKNGSGEVTGHLATLLTSFGFPNVKVSMLESPKNPYWLALCKCGPLGDPSVCIIPHFSSHAKGRYRVLGLVSRYISEKRPDEESIVNLAREVRDAGGTEPIIILYFGRMTAQRRRDLAELCWQRRRSFLVIDESLVFFLCNERFSRLPVLFQCALPFTVAEPYTTTASLVPVEMFFGREQERRAIVDPYGTNLVYGGRQLGKTALLRDVERRENNLEQGRVVRWIDLKNRGIGIDLPAEDLWAVLGQDLNEVKVLSRPATTYQTVVERIKDWLNSDTNRRILLLLDEADAFLEADSRAVNEKTRHSFPEVSRLKGLMDDTDRRFKVVFSGLHNVQRVARDPNTPVGHLGTPICIGPLLDNGEWRQARDLIEIPFKHMGYKFDPPDLWMRILSYTNYYPSLIQVFCKHLLEYLHNRDRTHFDFRKSPPYIVTAQQVEDVYQSAALQGEIRHKFELTLGLDERYRLIALCVALASIEQQEDKVLVDGFDVSWVRDQALSWWPGGFASDTSYELFRTILDEMIGLGILRRAGADRYALRSPNVLNLLGSKSQIEQKLMDVSQLPQPPNYEAASFRRSLNADFWTRSPLTADQEASLIERANGVTVIYGSYLSGLGSILPALSAIPSQTVYFKNSLHQLNQFTDWLREIDRNRPDSEVVTLAAVTPENRWSNAWVRQAADFVGRKTSSTKRFFRIVFIADPELAWYCVEDRLQQELDLGELSLKPWRDGAMRRWLEDADLGAEAVNNCSRILTQTGGWDMLVHAFGEKCRLEPHKWREHLADISLSWPGEPRWGNCCGLPEAVIPVLRVMAQWNAPIDIKELKTLEPDADISKVLEWAERLNYIREVETDQWLIDPIVGLLVKKGD